MNPNQALWEKGDFTRVAQSMRRSGESAINKLGIPRGMKILDLGCGDGTTALPEAMLGAEVLGVDIASNLVEAGKKRAGDAGLTNCKFQQGDASNLHELKEKSFELVVSMFGAMFAPKPFDVAKEMVNNQFWTLRRFGEGLLAVLAAALSLLLLQFALAA